MTSLQIRPAQPEDRDTVLAFCSSTWDWGDYISHVWDDWLHDTKGQLLVALIDGRPVGIDHLRMLNSIEAWLEGLRVDPAYRKHGIAKNLNNELLAEALRRGAKTVRLITESTNSASIHILGQTFFRQIGAFASFKSSPDLSNTNSQAIAGMPVIAKASDLDKIIEYLDASNVFPLVGGLYYHGFTAYTITDTLLREKISAQQVYLLYRWNRLDGLAIAEPREGRNGKDLSIGYIDGTTDSISVIIYALRSIAGRMKLESVYCNVPDLLMVRDAFAGAEYKWDGKIFYTYERILD